MRLVFRTREGERPVRQGQPYELPPLSERLGSSAADQVSPEFWMERLIPLEPKERRSELLRTFAWTSPINTRALLGAALSPDAGPEATRAALEAGWGLWSKLAAVARGELKADPVLLETPKGLQPYPMALPGIDRAAPPLADPAADHPGLLELIAEAVARDATALSPSDVLLPAALVARLERHVENLRRRVARLEQEEADLPDPSHSDRPVTCCSPASPTFPKVPVKCSYRTSREAASRSSSTLGSHRTRTHARGTIRRHAPHVLRSACRD